jgi:hypothetical protein
LAREWTADREAIAGTFCSSNASTAIILTWATTATEVFAIAIGQHLRSSGAGELN